MCGAPGALLAVTAAVTDIPLPLETTDFDLDNNV
jgi:hypothetical protein